MQHAILFLYFIIFSFGIIVTGALALLAYKSKSAKLFMYFILLTAYSMNLFTIILDSYTRINIPLFFGQNEDFWIHTMMFTHFLLMFSILLLNRYFSSNGKVGLRWVPYALLSILLFVYDWLFPRYSTGAKVLGFPVVDVIFFGSILFVLAQGFFKILRHEREHAGALHQLELTFFKQLQYLLLILLPFVLNDDLHFVQSPLRFSPILYAAINFIFLRLLFRYYLANYYISESDITIMERATSHPVLEHYGITDRERETIYLVLKGYSNRQISDELCVSLATVKTHLYNIYKKTGINSRFALISMMKKTQ